MEIARAKTNYWRRHRNKKEEADEMEEDAWMIIKEGILTLEEKEGEWIKEEDDIRLLKDRDNTKKLELKIKLKSPIMNLSIMGEEEEEKVRGMEEGAENPPEKSPVSERASKQSSQTEISKRGQSSQNQSRMATGVQDEGIRKMESGTWSRS